MPVYYQIINGPPFKQFVFSSTMFDRTQWIQRFTTRGNKQLLLTVIAIGKFMQGEGSGSEDDDQYCFIGHNTDNQTTALKKSDTEIELFYKHYFFLGQYNTRTRRGYVYRINPEKLFTSPIGELLFGGETEKFYRDNHWMK